MTPPTQRDRIPECPKCSERMEAGFTLDVTDPGTSQQAQWVDGTAERSIWTGLKLKGHVAMPITTWRCPACGLLESYANLATS